jgi:phosphoglycolate phosphatase
MTRPMARRYSLLMFDWDGTLMDSAAAIAQSLQLACRDLGLPVPTDEAARYIIGLGLADALRHAVPSLQPADYGRLVERYRVHFHARDTQTVLFDGVREGLDELRSAGFLLGIATGKSRRGLDRALATTGLGPVFQGSRCADEGHTKPHPGMLHQLMSDFGVEAQAALMIGDTTHDLEMARSAGVDGLGCAYGAHPRAALVALQPKEVVGSFAEAMAWLVRHG